MEFTWTAGKLNNTNILKRQFLIKHTSNLWFSILIISANPEKTKIEVHKICFRVPGVVVDTCNPRTREAEASRSKGQSQP